MLRPALPGEAPGDAVDSPESGRLWFCTVAYSGGRGRRQGDPRRRRLLPGAAPPSGDGPRHPVLPAPEAGGPAPPSWGVGPQCRAASAPLATRVASSAPRKGASPMKVAVGTSAGRPAAPWREMWRPASE